MHCFRAWESISFRTEQDKRGWKHILGARRLQCRIWTVPHWSNDLSTLLKIWLVEDPKKMWWYAMISHRLPKWFPVDTVEGFQKIKADDPQCLAHLKGFVPLAGSSPKIICAKILYNECSQRFRCFLARFWTRFFARLQGSHLRTACGWNSCSKSFQASSGKSLNYSAVKLVSSAALAILARPLLPSILLVQTVWQVQWRFQQICFSTFL